MKLPLKYGIPLLIVLWLASGFIEYGQGKTLLMTLAIGVALWTAFSLPRPRRREPEELEDDLPPESAPSPADKDSAVSADKDTITPTNGSGRPLSRSLSPSGKRSEQDS